MSALKSGSSLRSLLLTPERIPTFLVPSRSPLLLRSPGRGSSDRMRLLSEPDDEDSPCGSPAPAASPRLQLRLPPRIRTPRRAAAAAARAAESADTDLTTRAAMSLAHVEKATTPYGFRAVLTASPCTRRRESLFHRNKPVTVTVTDTEERQDPADPPPPAASSGSGHSKSRVRSVGVYVMKELKKPAAALKGLSLSLSPSPAGRRSEAR